MKNSKLTSILFIILISSLSCLAQTFNITGSTTGVEDGTWLYLKTASPQVMLDSTKIKDGKFKLVGKTNDKVSQMLVHTKNFSDYIFFWAEKNTHLSLKDGAFKKAIITGSKTQTEADLRNKLTEPNQKLQDSLNKLFAIEKDDIVKGNLLEKLAKAKEAEKELDMQGIIANPNSIISAYILSVYTSTWGKEKSAELFESLSPEMKNTSYGKTIKSFLTLNKEIKIGGKFADFEQANTAGKKIKLSSIKAKYILLEFWGSWCGPCREENPNLVKTYNAFKSKGFEILGVAADDNKAQWLKAIKDDQLPWENVCDLKGDKNEAALIYSISAFPTNYLIDENGIIIAKNLRGEALSKKLAELLP